MVRGSGRHVPHTGRCLASFDVWLLGTPSATSDVRYMCSLPPMSELALRASVIGLFPLDVRFGVGLPFFVDLDEYGGCKPEQGLDVREDSDLVGSSLEFLLDRSLDAV